MIKLLLFSTIVLSSCSSWQHQSDVAKVAAKPVSEPDITEPFVDTLDYSLKSLSNAKSNQALKLFSTHLKTRKCVNQEYCEIIPQRTSTTSDYKKRFAYKDLSVTQKLSFENNLNILRKIKSTDLEKNASKFLDSSCPKRTTAAVALRIEHLNFNLSEKLFESVLACPADSELENMYVRYALINFKENKFDKARDIISKALSVRSTDAPRTLYWSYKIFNDKKYADELQSRYPYSFHAVKYAEEINYDLFQEISSKRWIIPQRRDTELNYYVESLLKNNMDAEAYMLVNLNLDALVEKDVNNLFYLIKLISINSRDDYTVRLVSKIAYKYPSVLNTQLLTLSYKMSYLDKFKSHTTKDQDNYLFLSLSKQESGFYEKAKSKANARGLMQLLPSTARSISKSKSKDLYNVDNNIELGTKYFYSLYNQYNSVEMALAAYNAGPGNVNKWNRTFEAKNPVMFMDLIPIKETRNYVSSILKFNYFYVKMAEEFKDPSVKQGGL